MGTRFIAAEESSAFAPYKQMVVDADFSDLLLTNSFTGGYAYYLRPSIVAAGLDPDKLETRSGMDLTGSQSRIKAWKDIWSAGQGVGTVHRVEPVLTIVERLEAEYRAACQLS
jgi:nitronate monooxygenase